jgi:putative membrane protein
MGFIVTWLVTTVSILILSRLPIGIEVKDTGTALVAAFVLGLLNAFVRPILGFLALPITIVTLGLFALVLNGLMLWLVDAVVPGFSMRSGFWTALIGAILLAILNALLFFLIPGI